MKKLTRNRKAFDTGINILKILLFVVALVATAKFILGESLGVRLSNENTIFMGVFFGFVIVIYEFISNFTKNIVNKIHYEIDRSEAISTLEKHDLNVGMLLTDLPKDSKNNELRDCIEAYMTLKNQNLPFVLIDSDNESTSRLYFLGKRGKQDFNKYKLIIRRNLD